MSGTRVSLFNRLGLESSPYLQQHASNPVHWFPWGEEAMDAAAALDRPIFLSIGYSTCHWCHVMERESFSDPEVAKKLNDTFICIKVDREERPDIDELFMTACQMMTGSGGWPLTLLLTPEGHPFFAATYLPRAAVGNRIGLLELPSLVSSAWRDDRPALIEQGGRVLGAIQSANHDTASSVDHSTLFKASVDVLHREYDATYSGFGTQHKFPTPQHILVLLRDWIRSGNPESLEMATSTLTTMRLSGLYDHVGRGFHRYATDSSWGIPHFEKMLYDQALLLVAYSEGAQLTGDPLFLETAMELGESLLSDWRSPEGLFYSAVDADSEGQEGAFYLWTLPEFLSVLTSGPDALTQPQAETMAALLSVTQEGNLGHHGGFPSGANVLRLGLRIDAFFLQKGIPLSAGRDLLSRTKALLLSERIRRVPPRVDTQNLTDWNGLAIAALARGGLALGRPDWVEAAQESAGRLFDRMEKSEGLLLHRGDVDGSGVPGFASDYAFLIWALLELHQATLSPRWLEHALRLQREMSRRFGDEASGGFYLAQHEVIPGSTRLRSSYDGSVPSANSIAAWNLVRLGRITGSEVLVSQADRVLSAFGERLLAAPSSHNYMLLAVDHLLGPSPHWVFSGCVSDDEWQSLRRVVTDQYQPNATHIAVPHNELDLLRTRKLVPNLVARRPLEAPGVACCTLDRCLPEATTADDLLALLQELFPLGGTAARP